jgi:hypothetical protein
MTQKGKLPPRKKAAAAPSKRWQTIRLHGAATDLYRKWSHGLQATAVKSLPQQKRDHGGHRDPHMDGGRRGAVDETVSYTG